MRKIKILVIDDENLICWSFEKKLSNKNYDVVTADSGEKGLELAETMVPDVVFIDNKLPGISGLEVLKRIKEFNETAILIFMTAYGTIETAVQAMKLGAFEYVNKPFTFDEIEIILENVKKKIKLEKELQVFRWQQKEKVTFDHIIGKSPAIKQTINLARKIASSEASTILLLGESGTGKDLFARVIHNESSRGNMPFVTINCASLPENLLESELFGHEKGAFTDAKKQKKGLFEVADGGTVYLDEIGEMNPALQAKLLGIIENKSSRRLGGTKDFNIDVRIIAATNKNLEQALKDEIFREDLYYRLKVFQLTLPPLRERKEDIPILIQNFIDYFNFNFRKNIKGISPEAEELMKSYGWPGNVREMRNVIERAIILETSDIIQVDTIPVEITGGRSSQYSEVGQFQFVIPEKGVSLFELEKNIIKQALERTKYNQTQAAHLLGISRDVLRYKKKKYKL
ncbi:MAG: sigma-54-dependent Fis family transcriptional regulator [Calditrichaeota bacterium]|nr:sigma-54-dependent Fis family transcriptional regulator [Calditrichota bacterium]